MEKNEEYVPLLDISKIHEALESALKACQAFPVGATPAIALEAESKVAGALGHLGYIVKFRPGELVQFQAKDGKWRNGVVVALMMCEPRYICGRGDVRNEAGKKEGALLGCPRKYVRTRPRKK